MKKLISPILLAATFAVSALGVSVSASEGGKAFGKVPATDVKITIDGKKDAIYDKGLSLKIDRPQGKYTPGKTTNKLCTIHISHRITIGYG